MNKPILKRTLSLMLKYKAITVFAVLAAIPAALAQLITPVLTGNAIDEMLGMGNVSLSAVMRIIIYIALTSFIGTVSGWGVSECANRLSFKMAQELRNQAIEKIHKLPLSYLDSHRTGEVISRVVSDTESFSEGLRMCFTKLFSGTVLIIGTLCFMLALNPVMAAVVVVLTPLSLLTAAFIAKKTFSHFKIQSACRGEATAFIEEMISGHEVVKAFGREEATADEFDEYNQNLKNATRRAVFFGSLVNPTTRFLNGLVYAGVGLAGAFSIISGSLTVGGLSCFLTYANRFSKPFNEISGVIAELQNSFACCARIYELLDEAEEPDNAEKILIPDGNVEINNISFSYNKATELIKDFSLSVKPGMRVAIVGPTGCGKTTLINLLMRFYDVDSGSILCSDTDIRDVSRASLHSSYGMVLQETWLKNTTIRDNIAYGRPDADISDIIKAAKASHADSFIKKLPDGYNTVLSGDGGGLSTGQLQLLCIARVMLCLPPMLILDEATSNIDTRTELKIQSAFAEMMAGRTSFIVAHRLSTIKEADIILVMKSGKIIEQGTHNSLLAMNGFYSSLYNSQFEQD